MNIAANNMSKAKHGQKTEASVSSEFISALFETFESSGVKYCVLRNYENLPVDHGNDIDILIAPENYKTSYRLLLIAARKNGWLYIGHTDYFGYHKLYFSSLRPQERLLRIDVQTGSLWKGIPSAATSYILKHRVKRNDLWIASPGAEAATFFINELLTLGTIKKRNNARHKIQSLAQIGAEDFLACLSPCFGQRIAEWLLHQAQEGNLGTIEQRYQMLRWAVTWRAFVRNPVGQVLRWVRFLGCHLRQRTKRPSGLFVVLLGPDGSGKTTIAEGLTTFWKSNFSKEVVYLHGDFKLLPRLRNIRRLWARIRRKPMKPDVDFTKRHSGALVEPHSVLRALCYLSYYTWDYVLGHFSIFWHKGKDRLIISDRYFHEYFYQPKNINVPHWLLHLLMRAIPKPDLIVYLERNPDSIYKGKDELTVAEIERQQNFLRDLIENIPDSIRVNGDNGIGETVREIQGHILSTMSYRNT